MIGLLFQYLPFILPFWAPWPLLIVGLCRPRLRVAMAVWVMIGTSALYQASHWQDRVLSSACERVPLQLSGSVDGLVTARYMQVSGRERARYLRFAFTVERIDPPRCAGPGRLLLYWSTDQVLSPGDHLEIEALLRRPWGYANPGGDNRQRQLFIDAVHGVGSVRSAMAVASPSSGSVLERVERRRDAVSGRLQTSLDADMAALAAALFVGDRRLLNEEHWSRLRSFGLTHLMVISGMHVSMLAGLGWALGSLVARGLALAGLGRRRDYLAPFSALGLAAVFTVWSGSELPATRALFMLAPVMVCFRQRGGASGWHLLGAALLAILFLWPSSSLGASFWLSAGAVAILLWASPWRQHPGFLRRLLRLHGYLVVAMVPLGLLYFSTAATLGGLANLLAVPLVGAWVLPLGLLGTVLTSIHNGLAEGCWQLAVAPLQGFWELLASAEPFVERHTLVRAAPAFPILALAMLAALGLPLPRGIRRMLGCGVLLIPLWVSPGRPAQQAADVTVFDVGQGTAVLVRDGTQTLLYDTGGGVPGAGDLATTQLLPFLRSEGVTRINLLVVSHLDLDHSAGLVSLQAAMPVDELWSGRGDIPESRACRLGKRRRLGENVTLTVRSAALIGDSDNNSSCTLQIELIGATLLLPGDIDRNRERELVAYWGEALQSAALVAAHHGSRTSSSALWLRHVRPADALFTAARANRFGHPHEAVIARFGRSGARQWNTAAHGALTLRAVNGAWEIAATRGRWRPFWWLWRASEL